MRTQLVCPILNRSDMNRKQMADIEDVLKTCLRNKFQNYNPEPAAMPFHTRLLGKDRLALYSFIHSLSTNFGTTIFEPVALSLAQKSFQSAKKQARAGNQISDAAHKVIQKIMDNLSTAKTSPDKTQEIEAIREVCQKGKMQNVGLTLVDLWMEKKSGELFLFDIKTAKPNAGGFEKIQKNFVGMGRRYTCRKSKSESEYPDCYSLQPVQSSALQSLDNERDAGFRERTKGRQRILGFHWWQKFL